MSHMQDRIDAYMRGEMSAADRQAFERDIQHDQALRQRYRLTVSLRDELAARHSVNQRARAWMEENNLASEQSATARYPAASAANYHERPRRNIWAIVITTAACLLVGGLIITPFLTTHIGTDASSVPEKSVCYAPARNTAATSYDIQETTPADATALVQQLMDQECNQEALDTCQAFLEAPQINEDASVVYELRWLEITLLRILGRGDEAKERLQHYITLPGVHRSEALGLWEQYEQSK